MKSTMQFSDIVNQANTVYRQGDFETAEKILQKALKTGSISMNEKEAISDRLAALACEQGLYSSAAFFYLQVLQLRSKRLAISSPELKRTIRNYRILLTLAQKQKRDEQRLIA